MRSQVKIRNFLKRKGNVKTIMRNINVNKQQNYFLLE